MRVTNEDAVRLMQSNRCSFEVIDLDPYGSASVFLDSAVSSVVSGGLLAVTSTDSLVLNGNNTGTCYLRYGGVAVKAPYGHELALRLLLGAVQSSAARHRRSIKVLAGFSIDFYYRIFVQISDDPGKANEAVINTGVVYQCCQCEAFKVCKLGRVEEGSSKYSTAKPGRLDPSVTGNCRECGGSIAIGGPFYTGSLYDEMFIDKAISTVNDCTADFPFIVSWDKIQGLLYGLKEELSDVPLFYSLSALSNSMKLPRNIKLNIFRAQLKRLGFRVSGSHREPGSIKTDASSAIVYDILRAFAKIINFQITSKTPELAKNILLSTTLDPAFCEKLDFNDVDFDGQRVVGVYLPNPQINWGPKPAAKRRRTHH